MSIPMHYFNIITSVIFALFRVTSCEPPGQISSPTVISIRETSSTVGFTELSDIIKYYVTITPRHSEEPTKIITTTTGNISVNNLLGNTLYYVTVKAENTANEIGEDSQPTIAHTLPGAPSFTLSDPLSTSLFIGFQLNNYARISEWTIQYREVGTAEASTTVTTPSNQYFQYWLSGLTPDAEYEIRARVSQLYGTNNLNESEVDFSRWQTFRTASLSVFGRVKLAGQTYVAAHSTEGSLEWNTSLSIISNGYSASSILHNGISIIEIENSDGIPLVFYQIKVKDKILPSATDFTLGGINFSDSFVNNGDVCVGTPINFFILTPFGTGFTLIYRPDDVTTDPDAKTEKYMFISPENGTSSMFKLSFDSVETEIDAEDSLIVQNDGDLILNDGKVKATLPLNAVIGLTPRFLVKDNLKNQTNVLLYAEYYQASNPTPPKSVDDHFFLTTVFDASVININSISYSSSSDGTSVALNIPSVDKAIKYEVLDDSDAVMATIDQSEIDGSSTLKVQLSSLTNGTAYSVKLRVTVIKQDGTESSATSDVISITPSSNQCSSCSSDASCSTIASSSNTVQCNCNVGFSGDGLTCSLITTTDASVITTQETTSTTLDPTTTTAEPTTATTPEPTTTTLEPTTTSSPEPTTTTTSPEPTTTTTSPEPTTTTTAPEPTTTTTTTTTPEPTTTTTTTPEPTTTTLEPTTTTTTTPEPTTTTPEPTTTASEPTTTTTPEPTTTTTSNPTSTTPEPTTTTPEPSTTTPEPTTATPEPTTTTSEPLTTTAETTTTTPEQAPTTLELTATTTPKPTTKTPESTTNTTPKPTTTTLVPTTTTFEPTTTTFESTTTTPEPNITTSERTTTTKGPTSITSEATATTLEPIMTTNSESTTIRSPEQTTILIMEATIAPTNTELNSITTIKLNTTETPKPITTALIEPTNITISPPTNTTSSESTSIMPNTESNTITIHSTLVSRTTKVLELTETTQESASPTTLKSTSISATQRTIINRGSNTNDPNSISGGLPLWALICIIVIAVLLLIGIIGISVNLCRTSVEQQQYA